MKKTQQIITLVLSLGFIAVFAALFWILPDADESTVERRHLAKSPALSFSSVANGSFMNGFEKYMLDQFPLRNGFRSLKAAVNAKAFIKRTTTGFIPSESTSQSWIFRRTLTRSNVPHSAFGMCMTLISGTAEQRHICR